jgi:putative ABC transport system substrate-binding protein
MTANGRRSFRALFSELAKRGYVEGQTVFIERYSGEGRVDIYAVVASKVVGAKPDLIISMHDVLTNQLKRLTTSIPIISISGDPVVLGVVSNIARTNSNVTGISIDAGFEIFGKRFQLLRESVGALSNTRFLCREDQSGGPSWKSLKDAADKANISISPAIINSFESSEYERVFAALNAEHVDGLFLPANPEHITRRQLIVDLAAKHGIPTIYDYREFVEAGGLMSYGVDLVEALRRLVGVADEVLRGKKPEDIPIAQPTKFELIINQGAARTLRLQIPSTVLATADELL